MRRALALAAAGAATLGVSVGVIGAATGTRPHVVRGCPVGIDGTTATAADVDQVIEIARSVEVDHVIAHFQGRAERRTNLNTPVIEVIELGWSTPVIGGEPSMRQLAARRCGARAARYSWAVVFHDGLNVLCCIDPIVFVTPTRRAWYVF